MNGRHERHEVNTSEVGIGSVVVYASCSMHS